MACVKVSQPKLLQDTRLTLYVLSLTYVCVGMLIERTSAIAKFPVPGACVIQSIVLKFHYAAAWRTTGTEICARLEAHIHRYGHH